jgi:hypothetical protein
MTGTAREDYTMSIKQKFRARRDIRQFERALSAASPSMRHELIAQASRNTPNG